MVPCKCPSAKWSEKWIPHVKAREMEKNTPDLIVLTIGEPDIPVNKKLVKICSDSMKKGRTRYVNRVLCRDLWYARGLSGWPHEEMSKLTRLGVLGVLGGLGVLGVLGLPPPLASFWVHD